MKTGRDSIFVNCPRITKGMLSFVSLSHCNRHIMILTLLFSKRKHSFEQIKDFLGQYCGFKDFRDFQSRLTDEKSELHGMNSVRLEGEKVVKSLRGGAAQAYPNYSNLGYRFRFNDKNNTSF
jgi:hypothetical protein